MVGMIGDRSTKRRQVKAKGWPDEPAQRRRMAAPVFIASTNSLEPL
jgi:hypothetical protein